MLVDPYGRRLCYLRVSVTDRCNLRCVYCMPPQGVAKLSHEEILTLEEIARIVRVAAELGVEKVRLTGGEPLVRRNLEVLLMALGEINLPGGVHLTTNGWLLGERLELLERAGVRAVNISLDSLDPARYGIITGIGEQAGAQGLKRVMQAIEAAVEVGAFKVKINTVVLRDLNLEEVEEIASLSLRWPVAVRFIEYMPVGRHTPYRPESFVPAEEVLGRLRSLGTLLPLPSGPSDGPARRYRVEGAPGEVGVISAVSSHFCMSCNRLRLTADGRVVPCLFSRSAVDLRELLRRGATDDELAQALEQAARIKPASHPQAASQMLSSSRQMSTLGG